MASKVQKVASKVQTVDIESLIAALEDQMQSWTPQTLETHPQCRLLFENRLFLTSTVVQQLIRAILCRMSPVVTQALQQTALSTLESLIQLLLGLTVKFSVKGVNSASLSARCVASLAARFSANVSKDCGVDVEFSAPLPSFVAGGLSLNPKEFSIGAVDVQLPKELSVKLKQRGNDGSKLESFKSFLATKEAFPLKEFLASEQLALKTYTLQDEYGSQMATLDPFSRYMTIGDTTFLQPRFDPKLACVYFSSFPHSNYGRILALAYDSERSTFYAEVSESSPPGAAEWVPVQLHRLHV